MAWEEATENPFFFHCLEIMFTHAVGIILDLDGVVLTVGCQLQSAMAFHKAVVQIRVEVNTRVVQEARHSQDYLWQDTPFIVDSP